MVLVKMRTDMCYYENDFGDCINEDNCNFKGELNHCMAEDKDLLTYEDYLQTKQISEKS